MMKLRQRYPAPATPEDCAIWKRVTLRWSNHSGRRQVMRSTWTGADRRAADLMLTAQVARAYEKRGLGNPFPGDIDAGGEG